MSLVTIQSGLSHDPVRIEDRPSQDLVTIQPGLSHDPVRIEIQSGLRMGGNGILWILCLGQILSAGAMPMSDDEEGLLNSKNIAAFSRFMSILSRFGFERGVFVEWR